MKLKSFVQGKWTAGTGEGKKLYHAVSGESIAEVTSEGLDFKSILSYARDVGGPARALDQDRPGDFAEQSRG